MIQTLAGSRNLQRERQMRRSKQRGQKRCPARNTLRLADSLLVRVLSGLAWMG